MTDLLYLTRYEHYAKLLASLHGPGTLMLPGEKGKCRCWACSQGTVHWRITRKYIIALCDSKDCVNLVWP